MKQIFRKIMACMLALVFCCISAGATASDYSLTYQGGDSDVNISGAARVEKANRQITLQILSDGVSVDDPGFDPTTDILYMHQVMTDVNGGFTFTFTVSERGEHTVRISESGSSLTGVASFYRSTEEELADAVLQLNGAYNNATAMDAVISGNSAVAPSVSMVKILQIDPTEYASLKTDGAFLENLSSKTYTSVPEFMSRYKLAKLIVELSRATDGETVESLLEASDNAITFTGKNAGLIFDEYTDSEKSDIYDVLATKNYASTLDVQNALYEAVIVNEIAACNTYQAKFAVLENNNDVLNLDMTKCTALGTYVEGFKSELAAGPLNSISGIRTSFDAMYLKHLGIKQKAEADDDNFGGVGGSSRPSSVVVSTGTQSNVGPTPTSFFNDIDQVAWAKEAIEALAAKGVISGKSENTFAPYDNITRAEFAKILFGSFGLVDDAAQTEFIDVPNSHWAYKYVATAHTKGIVNGVGDGVFGANDAISRQDIVTLCYRLTQHLSVALPETNGVSFDDGADIAPYAVEAADKMKAAGIVNGKGDNRFDPTAPATRAEATKIIYGLMQYCQK